MDQQHEYNQYIISQEIYSEMDDWKNEKNEFMRDYLSGKIVGKLDVYTRLFRVSHPKETENIVNFVDKEFDKLEGDRG